MHDEDCRLPSLDWLTKTYQTIPNACSFEQLEPTTSVDTQPSTNFVPEPPSSKAKIDYSKVQKKPPYSYSQMIVQAMKHLGGEKVLLTDIYNFIKERYAWYRLSDTSWQSSIRHNLSINSQFVKIPRSADDRRKGSYWKLELKPFNSNMPKARTAIYEKRKEKKKFVSPATEIPQVNPALLTLLKDNTDTLPCTQPMSVSSKRSSPQIMEIGVEENELTEGNFSNAVFYDFHNDFSTFSDDLSIPYDSNFQLSSFYTDVEYNPETTLMPEQFYQQTDENQCTSKSSDSWLLSEEKSDSNNNYGPLMDTNPNPETTYAPVTEQQNHPWQDDKLTYTNDDLLFDFL